MGKSNGYISNTEWLTNGSHGTVEQKTRSDGTVHTTVHNDTLNRRVSFDTKPDGSIEKIHSTNQNTGKHQNYGSGPKK